MGLAESAKKWFNYPIDPIIRDPIKRRPLKLYICNLLHLDTYSVIN